MIHRFVAILALVAAGCHTGGGLEVGPTGPTTSAPEAFQQHQSANFTFHFRSIDAATIADAAFKVEVEYARIMSDQQLASMPRVSVFLHPDFPSLQEAVRGTVGTLPSFAKGLATGPTTIHVLSPNLSTSWSYAAGVTAIVHEFAHCVSWQINGSIPNNPRWLWETVAVFEARQFVHPHSIPWLATGQPATFAWLNSFDNTDIYDVGFLIGEFITSQWGQAAIGSLVRNNGNVAAVTGLNEATFLTAWLDHVRRSYGAHATSSAHGNVH